MQVFQCYLTGATSRSRSRRPQPERVAGACAAQAPEVFWSLVHAFDGDIVGGLEQLLEPTPGASAGEGAS
eukprot:COSAG02_NODE_1368_length_13029_cov_83.912142_11_plen_70_part_00